MTDIANQLWACLNVFLREDRDTAIAVAAAWVEANGSGHPDVPLFQEKVRSDALFWAEAASPPEVEAYVVAGIDRMKNTAFGGRQMKRMAGTIWRRMSPKERAEFQEWIMGAGKDAK